MAFELLNKAVELGSCGAHFDLGGLYNQETDDTKRIIRHYKLAAIGGHELARDNLGIIEMSNGNINHAMKHYMIGAKSGHDESLKKFGDGYKAGYVTKEEYASTLRAHQNIRDEMKSDERAKAAQR